MSEIDQTRLHALDARYTVAHESLRSPGFLRLCMCVYIFSFLLVFLFSEIDRLIIRIMRKITFYFIEVNLCMHSTSFAF